MGAVWNAMRIGFVENDDRYAEELEERLTALPGAQSAWRWDSAERCLQDERLSQLDLIILDIFLPRMNGAELARYLNERFPELKIIMLTNAGSDDLIFDSIRNGASGYVLKSELEDLGRMVDVVMQGGAALTPAIALRVLSSFRGAPEDAPALTARERQVLELMVRGKSVPDVANLLGLSVYTVQGYSKAIYKKLQVHNRAELVRRAHELRLA